MDIELSITLPEKVSTNKVYAGVHWRKRKEWADLYHQEFWPIKGKVKVEKYPVVITYDFSFKANALDSLNCAMMAKMLEDGMVAVGILKDDCPEYVAKSIITSKKVKGLAHDTVLVSICSLK